MTCTGCMDNDVGAGKRIDKEELTNKHGISSDATVFGPTFTVSATLKSPYMYIIILYTYSSSLAAALLSICLMCSISTGFKKSSGCSPLCNSVARSLI